MDLSSISPGQTASPKVTQAYIAFGFPAVILQSGYLIITGVLYPTPLGDININLPTGQVV